MVLQLSVTPFQVAEGRGLIQLASLPRRDLTPKA